MRNEPMDIMVLISANEEWKIVREIMKPMLPLTSSPFGEWFSCDIGIQGLRKAVVFFHTGSGKIPTAAATQFILDRWRSPLIVNLGTCGGFKGKVNEGDILLVTKTVVYDIFERNGHADKQIMKYTSNLDLSWLKKPYPTNAKPATIASADHDLISKRFDHLSDKYGAVGTDWESGAIAYVASKNNNTRCLILRGVSDVVDSSDGSPTSKKALRQATRAVMKNLIASLPEWIAKASI